MPATKLFLVAFDGIGRRHTHAREPELDGLALNLLRQFVHFAPGRLPNRSHEHYNEKRKRV